MNESFTIFPLGDSAITIDFGNCIDETINKKVLALFHDFSNKPFQGMIEAVPAYSSLTLYYDMQVCRTMIQEGRTIYSSVKELVEARIQLQEGIKEASGAMMRIPVCYEKECAPDIEQLAAVKQLTVQEVIQLHLGRTYRVYMLGFLPGFAYLGEVDERIKMPRKPQPVQVSAGSIGIAGLQTGIYPLASPGGWHIIGRTPLKLFDSNRENVLLLNPGDTVQFHSISYHEFADY